MTKEEYINKMTKEEYLEKYEDMVKYEEQLMLTIKLFMKFRDKPPSTKKDCFKITSIQQDMNWGKDTPICSYCGIQSKYSLVLNLKAKICETCFDKKYIVKLSNKLTHLEVYNNNGVNCYNCDDKEPGVLKISKKSAKYYNRTLYCLKCLYKTFKVEIHRKEVK